MRDQEDKLAGLDNDDPVLMKRLEEEEPRWKIPPFYYLAWSKFVVDESFGVPISKVDVYRKENSAIEEDPVFASGDKSYKAVYKSGWGEDGDLRIDFFANKRDLPQNRRLIEITKREINDLNESILVEEDRVRQDRQELLEAEKAIQEIESGKPVSIARTKKEVGRIEAKIRKIQQERKGYNKAIVFLKEEESNLREESHDRDFMEVLSIVAWFSERLRIKDSALLKEFVKEFKVFRQEMGFVDAEETTMACHLGDGHVVAPPESMALLAKCQGVFRDVSARVVLSADHSTMSYQGRHFHLVDVGAHDAGGKLCESVAIFLGVGAEAIYGIMVERMGSEGVRVRLEPFLKRHFRDKDYEDCINELGDEKAAVWNHHIMLGALMMIFDRPINILNKDGQMNQVDGLYSGEPLYVFHDGHGYVGLQSDQAAVCTQESCLSFK